jgi:uncharacterized protein
MPINAGVKYYLAEEEYNKAKTREEKIACLEKMMMEAPKHKGAHTLLAQLKKKLSDLKKEDAKAKAAASKKPRYTIRKEGAAQVCMVGPTNSGKSSVLAALTNAKVEIADYPYTTKEPQVGMMDYTGVKIQLIEIPSTFTPDVMSIVRSCDLVLILLDGTQNVTSQLFGMTDMLEKNGMQEKKILIAINKADEVKNGMGIEVSARLGTGLDRLKEAIWGRLGLIRIRTKSMSGQVAQRPLTLKAGSSVGDAVRSVHKTLLKDFKFARVFDATKYSGKKVGLEFVLKDLDTLEIHSG